MAATPNLETSIQGARGSGQPLDENIRQPMEKAFGGVDFSQVKVHNDTQSDQLNKSSRETSIETISRFCGLISTSTSYPSSFNSRKMSSTSCSKDSNSLYFFKYFIYFIC